jgi:hypothetical protein
MLRSGILALALAAPQPVYSPISFVQYPMVHRVDCAEGRGTAFRAGANHWISVAHVTAMHDCRIDGAPVTVTEQDGVNDFSRLDTATGAPNGFRINCHGFVPGQWYWSVGFAGGAPWQTALAVYATYAKAPDGKRVLIGPNDFIPGMSGGPVLNEAGEVVGTVNAYVPGTPISLSRELKDTSACGADIA